MTPLRAEWRLLGTAPAAFASPADLPLDGPEWHVASVPGTVAASLGVDLDAPGDLDGRDWWYVGTVRLAEGDAGGLRRVRFDGLATFAEGWLDGARIVGSASAFVPCTVEVDVHDGSTLVLVFRSVAAELARKRPRPRWKTALVDHPNLRWVRTPLVGRIPGWTPRLPVIGPWRPAWIGPVPAVEATDLHLDAGVEDGVAHLRVAGRLRAAEPVTAVTLHLGDRALPLDQDAVDGHLSGTFRLPDVPLWWPHTHGVPHREPWRLVVATAAGEVEVDRGRVGFRSVEADRADGGFALRLNGRDVFCRGACWTVEDVRAVDGPDERLAETVRLLVAAGANMVRVGGTMPWGPDAFYEACAAAGILVWQDLPFANMDYPFGDPAFAALVDAELTAQLTRLRRHPCLAVYCGGSEIEQQAAMLGLPASEWTSPFFAETAPAAVARLHPGVPCVPSTPTGGALPFHTGTGLTHYYGVGAYRRPLTDVRLARVRFSPECLGFAHVPEPEALLAAFGTETPAPHLPAWKAGVPRDQGAGWDFEDVRDHYVAALHGVDPVALRGTDLARAYAVAREVTGELLTRTYAEWRRPGSGSAGALVWFWKDLRPGAGWGVVDSENGPKAAWWHLRRAWARRGVWITDEGLDGLGLHVHNEHAEAWSGAVELELWKGARRQVAAGRVEVAVAPWGAVSLAGDAVLGRFTDLTWAYRFGPPGHDVVVARLRAADGAVIHEDVVFPVGHGLPRLEAAELACDVQVDADGVVTVTLDSPVFLQSVVIAAPGHTPDENHFHLVPGSPRRVRFTPRAGARAFRGWLSALNLEAGRSLRPA